MTDSAGSLVHLRATADDGYDGAIRILSDLQRFGFSLHSFRLARGEPSSTASFSLEVGFTLQSQSLADEIAHRLARHPSLRLVEATSLGNDPSRDGPNPSSDESGSSTAPMDIAPTKA